MLELQDLRKLFGTITAVDDLTLTIGTGELCVILGPSGCGKTTVLRLIAGLEVPDAGSISMSGEIWIGMPPQQRNVAMVFQHYALYPNRSVRANIEYPLRLRNVSAADRSEKVDRISSLLGLKPLLDRKPRQLSGGEAQRVALARALVRQPACFLLDEPLSNLDAQLRARARAEIKRIQRDLRVTALYVTHDQEDALALADKIAVMNKGRLVQVGPAEELFRHPKHTFIAQFLGRPPMNLVRATVIEAKHNSAVVSVETVDGSSRIETIRRTLPKGYKLHIGFRPDHVILLNEKEDLTDGQQNLWPMPGKVLLIEGLEPDYIVYCDTAIGTILVRVNTKPAEHSVKLTLPVTKAYYFDGETGDRLQ